jgi:hypothetical protein
VDDGRRLLCLASEPYRGMLEAALLHHVRESGLALLKLDNVAPWCNAEGHDHLPGRHSIEASMDALIAVVERARKEAPDLLVLWYGAGGARSPFFLCHGDYLFDKRITMEAASTADHPVLHFRDGVTLALDQATRFASLLPHTHTDSLGVWISDSRWANAMRTERWREAAVMDFGRGSMLFPQLWGDLRWLDDEDAAFLARLQALARRLERLFAGERHELGDPWLDAPYGYAYGADGRCLLFLHNAHFDSRPVVIPLDASLGLDPSIRSFRLFSHFPETGLLHIDGSPVLRAGAGLRTWLRPFEVALWEVNAEERDADLPPVRTLPGDTPMVKSWLLQLRPWEPSADLQMPFAEPQPHFRATVREPTLAELAAAGYATRVQGFQSELPATETLGTVLAVIVRFRQGGRPWRHRQPSSLVHCQARAGTQAVRFEPVPGHRQADNGQLAPWPGMGWAPLRCGGDGLPAARCGNGHRGLGRAALVGRASPA